MSRDTEYIFDKNGHFICKVDLSTGRIIGSPEHAADSPEGVSGRSLGSPGRVASPETKAETAGQATVPRVSEASPGNPAQQQSDDPENRR